jgi:hypothetical protein
MEEARMQLKLNKFTITLGIFVVLLVYFILSQAGGRNFSTINLPKLSAPTAEEIIRIEITRPTDRLVLEKKENQWVLTEPLQFPADKNKVENLCRSLGGLRIADLVSDRAGAEGDYGLTTATAVNLKVTSAKKTMELALGAANAASTHTFVRLPKDSRIYQVLGDLTYPLKPVAAEWRSFQIFDFSMDEVKTLTLARIGKPVVSFSKQEEVPQQIVGDSPKNVTPAPLPSKVVWKAEGRKEALNDPKVNQLLNTFARLSASRISDRTPGGKSLGTMTVVSTRNQTYVLEFLEYLPKEKRYLVRKSGSPVIYELDENMAQNLLKEMKDLI